MRHFRSILYAVVLAPAVWVLIAAGLNHVESFTALALLLLGGVAYGIFIFVPISPLGPTLAGLSFLTAAVWAAASPSAYADLWPSGDFDLGRPGNGVAALLAAPLLLTALNVRRWRGYEPLALPLVGQIGRSAPLSEPTTLQHLLGGVEDRTTLLHRPAADEGELTTVVRRPTDGEATTIIRRAPGGTVLPDEGPTEDVRSGGPLAATDISAEEPTTAFAAQAGAAEETTAFVVQAGVAEEPTTAFVTQGFGRDAVDGETTIAINGEEPATAFAAPGSDGNVADGETTIAVNGQEPTTALAVEGSSGDETTAFVAQEAGDADEPATVLDDADREVADGDESAAREGTVEDPAEPPTAASAAVDEQDAARSTADEPTTAVGADDAAGQDADDTSGQDADDAAGQDADDAAGQDEEPEGAAAEEAPTTAPVEELTPDTATATPLPEATADPSPADDETGPAAAEDAAADGDESATEAVGAVEESTPDAETEAPPADGGEDKPSTAGEPSTQDEPPAQDEAPPHDEPPAHDEPTAEVTAGDEQADEAEEGVPAAADHQPSTSDEPALGMAPVVALDKLPDEDAPGIEEPAPELVPIVVSTTDNGGARVPGEQTVEVRPGVRASGDTTQVLRVPGEDTRVIPRRGMDDTQVIRRPDDGERTQVLRPAGRGGGRTGNGKADRGGSIAGAESPNFADDPTGRLQIPVAQPEEPARTMTVMNLERPPEDGPEIPSPRRPSES